MAKEKKDVLTFLTSGIARAVGKLKRHKPNERQAIMAALQNLQTNLDAANLKLGELSIAVSRIVAALDPQNEVKIQAAADNVAGITSTLETFKTQIESVSPAPVV